jgi:hypothetical protein
MALANGRLATDFEGEPGAYRERHAAVAGG